jgi:hypothetical protein
MITFLLSGLWHGAAWHFVVWGALHGMFQIIGRSTTPLRNAISRKIGLHEESCLRKTVQVFITFALVCFAWVFFRANTIADAFLIMAKLAKLPAELAGYARMLPGNGVINTGRAAIQNTPGFGVTNLGLSVILILILLVADMFLSKTHDETIMRQQPLVLRWAGYYMLIIAIILSWNAGSSQFIYFTF